MTKHLSIQNLLATLLTMAALFAGQNAWAQNNVTLSEDNDFEVGTAGHWYVNMHRINNQQLTLSTEELAAGQNVFKVYDDGGKNGNYTPNCQSLLYITVPVGYLIQVSGTVWTKNDKYIEYLELYNANNGNFNRLADVYSDADGEAKDFGPLLTHKVTSNHSAQCTNGQYLTVYFRASDNETTYPGFDMTVTVFENTLYNVNIAEGITNGTVSPSTATAYYNDEVTLTMTPAENYYIGTVSYNDGTSDHVITPQNNVYKFTMPQHDVTVNATFLDEVGHLWGEGNDGSAEHPYVISSQEGWDLLVRKTTGTAGASYTDGKYFELATDISGVIQSVEYFGGHLDGKGHKITLAMDERGVGLINHIRSASSISNLTVEGSIVNSAKTVGGFVASASTYAITFTNCRCSVAITSSYSGNSSEYRGGGFIGSSSGPGKDFNRCVFDGSFSSNNNLSFFPWIGNNGGCTVTNSAYLYNGDAGFHNGSTEAQAYLQTPTEPAVAVRTGGTVIGNGAGTAYADGFTYGNEEYYASGATVTYGIPGIIATAAQYNDGTDHNASINPDGTASFIMPATTITATIITTNLEANYIDADGTMQTHPVSLLSSSEEAVTIAGGWYAVTGDVTLNKGLTFSGAAHLILTDGATLNVNDNGIGSTHIAIVATDLNIYGQTLGTGTLNADSQIPMGVSSYNHAYGIQASGSITFCGGDVNATATGKENQGGTRIYCYGIYAEGSITIIRGHVNAIATTTSSQFSHNLYNISAPNEVLLDWRLPTDRITVTLNILGNCSSVSVAEGKTLWNGTEVLSGGIQWSNFNNKTLQPCIAREVSGYDTGNGGWAFIASPVTADDGILPTAVGNIFSATEYDLYRLNPSNTMWENYKNPTHTSGFRLVNGQGYLYATKETKTLAFMGDAFNIGTEKTIENLPQGFNLVGNPFTVDAYVNKPYYTLNEDGSAILTTTSTAAIPPCTGVIVEVDENENITFSTTAPTLAVPNNGNLQITLAQTVTTRGGSSTETLDNAIVSFNEGSQLGKFYFGEQNGNIYIPQGNEEYAIVSAGGRDGVHTVSTEVPINFKAKENGEYTITVNPEGVELDYLHLIDNMTGADIDLLSAGDCGSSPAMTAEGKGYTFTAKTTDYESRFRLVFVCGDANDDDEAPFAFINNGNIIVNGTGTLQVIDVMGRVVYQGDAINRVSTSGMMAGVYVLRLINGDVVRVQKMVIE